MTGEHGHAGEADVAQPAFKSVFREPEYIAQPPSVPFDLDDNTDAIALRAAISSLQMQRQRAQEDMRQLQRVKREAVAHPEEWRRGLLDRYARKRRASQGRGRPGGRSPGMEDGGDARAGAEAEGMDVDGGGEVDEQHVLEVPETQQSGGWPSFGSSTGSHFAPAPPPPPPPGDLDHDHDPFQTPSMQNVVRMPPINWAKYHIIGEPLERMHRVQQSRPSDGLGGEGRATIAAPYSPFTDSLDSGQHSPRDVGDRKDSGCNAAEMLHPMQTRRGSRMLGG